MKPEAELTDTIETTAEKKIGESQLSFWETSAPSAPAPKKLSTEAVTKLVSNLNPEISSLVGSEIISGKLQPATWALALAYSNGSHDQAMTHYARLRLELLSDSATDIKAKEKALEARRRAGFKKMTVPLPRLYLGKHTPKGMRNRKRISLSPIWLGGLWISATAACAAFTRYASENFQDPTTKIGIPGSLALAALLVMTLVMIHLLLPKTRLLLRYAIPFGAWTAACASCYCGLMILKASHADNSDIGVSQGAQGTERKIIFEEMSQNTPPSMKVSPNSIAQAR